MKIKNLLYFIFLTININLLANSENIVDNTHKQVVNTLQENVKELPTSLQEDAKGIINDIDKDGKNLNFLFKLTNISYQTDFVQDNIDISTEPNKNNYLLATIGVMLLPNTWKIDISYTTEIGKNVFYEAKANEEITAYDIDEGDKKIEFINFYTKPINTSYGSIGFGYLYIKQTEEMPILYNTKILDIQNLAANQKGARYNIEKEDFYLTYTIPSKNKWYDGFGLSYTYGTSNQSEVSSTTQNAVILKPDTTSSKLTIGIEKTIDEINQGLELKSLVIGRKNTQSEFFNYETSQDESFRRTYDVYGFNVIYMFKPKKNKKIYTSLELIRNVSTYTEREEINFEVGILW